MLEPQVLENTRLIYVARHHTFPGYCAAFFFEPGDESALVKTFTSWRKLGYKPVVKPVDAEDLQAGLKTFDTAKKAAKPLELPL